MWITTNKQINHQKKNPKQTDFDLLLIDEWDRFVSLCTEAGTISDENTAGI